MKLFLRFLRVVILLSINSLCATKTFISDAGTGGFTFNFSAAKTITANVASNLSTGRIPAYFYTGRTDATTADATQAPYAVAGARDDGGTFAPLTPSIITLNGISSSANPLYGNQISLLGLLDLTPLVVPADNPTLFYWINSTLEAPTVRMTSAPQVKDAQGATGSDGSVTAGIVQIASAKPYVFAAVKKNGGNFGDVGGGIALMLSTDNTFVQQAAVAGDTGIKATPLDTTSSSIKITSNAASLSNSIVDMWWDDALQRLYITFQATAGAGASDGVRGVVVAYFQDGKLVIAPFAPASAFTGTNYIVGGVGSSTVTTIYKFRTMYTSTSLNYGIVLGNANDPATAQSTIYALPLVNKTASNVYNSYTADPLQGTLASKVTAPGTNLKTFYTESKGVNYYTGRGFQVAATDAADLTARTDQAALVGGGVAPGTVTDLVAYKDTVFVSTGGTVTTQAAGIFYSQALFDEDGAIKAWTPWQRYYTSNDPSYGVFGMGYQVVYGRVFTAEGTSSSAVKTIKSTLFSTGQADGILGGTTSNGSVGLLEQVQTFFQDVPAGVQMVNLFPSNHAGLSQTTNQKLSLMIFSGYQKIVIAQTGSQSAGLFTPATGDFSAGSRTFTTGAFNVAPAANTQLLLATGGALSTLGSINSSTIINDGNYGYLVVGGVNGVAVLRNSSGQGWASTGLQKNFSNIGIDKSFEIIGDYQNVRKVWADGTNLYILTDKKLDRIPAGQLAQQSPLAYTVATLDALGLSDYASFSDVVTSGKIAFLATSNGLYRSANGTNFATVAAATKYLWIPVTLPDSPYSVTRLYPLSTTGLGYDCAQQTGGGNLYVLAASVASGLSATYRFNVEDVSSGTVDDATLTLFNDYIIEDVNSGFVQWGQYRNYLMTDGSRVYAQRAAYLGQNPLVENAFNMTAGTWFRQRQNYTLPFTFTGYTALAPMVRTETGSLMVAGDNGLQVLE